MAQVKEEVEPLGLVGAGTEGTSDLVVPSNRVEEQGLSDQRQSPNGAVSEEVSLVDGSNGRDSTHVDNHSGEGSVEGEDESRGN